MPVKLLISIEGAMHITQLHVKSLMEDLEIEAPNEFVTLDPDVYEGSPARVAQMVRSLWHVPSGPIPNLVNLIESAGGVVVFRRFGTAKLDGMSCWARNTPPLFFINADIPMDRARLTIAHELGHLVMHFTAPAGDPEAEANEFALEFLAPAAEMAPDLRALRFPKLGGLKAKWGLSMAAILMAASRRGALTPSQSKSMWVQLSRYGYRKVEPFPLPIEEPTLMEQSIRIHRDEHGYSTDELATMLDLLPGEFERLYPLRPDPHPALSVLQ